MTAKVLYSGTTHNTSGPNGATRSDDGFLDIALPEAHPAAENLFGAAWSACYLAAIQGVAKQKKVTLPNLPSVDTRIDLSLGKDGYFLSANLTVAIPGLDRNVAQDLIDTAHTVCPYSKAVHGNIDVQTTLA